MVIEKDPQATQHIAELEKSIILLEEGLKTKQSTLLTLKIMIIRRAFSIN